MDSTVFTLFSYELCVYKMLNFVNNSFKIIAIKPKQRYLH